MKITFYGAAQCVTGSKHLIESSGTRVLLDCGMYQGRRQWAQEQNSHLPFDARSIDAVILSHAHVDHCGILPVLVKQGFAGKIYCTPETAEVARYILEDSAKLQEQDAFYLNAHLPPDEPKADPLYTLADVEETLKHFEPVQYFYRSREWTKVSGGISFKFLEAGHILGSCVTVLRVEEQGEEFYMAYTGDLGRDNVPILRQPEYIEEKIRGLIMECTYGQKNHRDVAVASDELVEIINETIKLRGKIIVPSFALGRTQELIYLLHHLVDQKKIPALPIYIDSPLALNLTKVFAAHSEDFDEQTRIDFGSRHEQPFEFANLTYIRSVEESKALNLKQGPFMVIASSGMCEGGRIRHHLKNGISDPNNTVLITGYQGQDTLGRKLLQGVSPVRILEGYYPVAARIANLDELSAHADQRGLLDYLAHTRDLEQLFLVHTEPPQSEAFKALVGKKFPHLPVHVPSTGESFDL